jgi:hypothetical protein
MLSRKQGRQRAKGIARKRNSSSNNNEDSNQKRERSSTTKLAAGLLWYGSEESRSGWLDDPGLDSASPEYEPKHCAKPDCVAHS